MVDSARTSALVSDVAAVSGGIPFLSSVPVSAVLLILGIVPFVVMCYKGIHTAVSALIASAIVALGISSGFIDTITSTFSDGLGAFAIESGLAFISAGFFSYLRRETRSGETIAEKFIALIGADHSPYIIAATAAVLQLAGIQSYIFIVAAMTFSLMEKANLPIYIGCAACIAMLPIVTFTFPGVTAKPNVLPTTYFAPPAPFPDAGPGHGRVQDQHEGVPQVQLRADSHFPRDLQLGGCGRRHHLLLIAESIPQNSKPVCTHTGSACRTSSTD